MDIKSYNKGLAQQCIRALKMAFKSSESVNLNEEFACSETDSVHYLTMAVKDKVTFSMFCLDIENVFNFVKHHMQQRYYPGIPIRLQTQKEKAIEITIDQKILDDFIKAFKPKKESGIDSSNERLHQAFEALGRKLASTKRHLFGSVFQIMIQAASKNTKVPNISYETKAGKAEKVWVAFEKNQFTVYYGVNFEDRSEQQLAKIYFSELVDSKKHVQNAPNIAASESELPKYLVDSFPEEKNSKYNFSNGIISITIQGKQIQKPSQTATFLASFRNYAYYHIQAVKCYLHSRLFRRITTFQKELSHAAIKPFAFN